MIEVLRIINEVINANDGFKYYLDIFASIIGVFNIMFVILVFRLTRKDINPKLSIIPSIIDANNKFDKGVNKELFSINFEQKGFSEIEHDTVLWKLRIVNNGDLPATNVQLKYTIFIKRAKFKTGIDEADIIDVKFINFKKISRTLKITYIPPQSEKIEKVLYLTGNFSKADLIVNVLKSKERSFIRKAMKIDEYEHLDFKHIQDSQHYRQVIGANGKYE